MREKRQDKGTLPTKLEKETKIRNLTAVLENLKDIKEIWEMKSGAGKRVFLSLIKDVDPLKDVFDNSGRTAYDLGRQSVIKGLISKLTEAGCEINVSDLSERLYKDGISAIYNEINKLERGETK